MKLSFEYIKKGFRLIYAKWKYRRAQTGKKITASLKLSLRNPQYFSIGDYCYFGPNCRIEAWDYYKDKHYTPQILIGKDVRINSTCHIGAINKIRIGNSCLLGSHVMIIDHSHGKSTWEDIEKHPSERDLYSKGEVVIGDRCWLGENVCILPGVHIGVGCIIGANAVVTKDIPDYSVAAGNPAKVVKTIQNEKEY